MKLILKLSYIAEIYNGSTPSSDNPDYWDGDIKWITPIDLSQVLSSKYIYDSNRKITNKGYLSCGTTLVSKDSLLLSTRAPIGLIAIAGDKMCTNQGCKSLVINRNTAVPNFIYYYLLSKKEDLQNLGSGSTFTELSSNSLKSFRIELPELNQQIKIVKFLDQKVSRIDAAIAKKKKLIELLEEKRILLITESVNSGKNQKKLKRIVKNIVKKNALIGKIYMLENIESWTGQILGTTEPENISGELISFKKGDVLFGKLRPYLAKIMLAFEEGSCSGEFLVLRHSKEMEPKFLFYKMITKEFINQVNAATYGAKMPRASWEILGNISIQLPALNEQKKIIEKLDRLTDKIAKAKNKIYESVQLLEEYKISLISNAVTGKLKVN